MVSEFISTFAQLNCLLLLSALKWSKCSGANHHQVEFFDWFFATQFLRSGTSIKTILSLYIKTPPLHFIFESVRKWEEKWHHKEECTNVINWCSSMHYICHIKIFWKNFVGNFFWHVSQLWICFIQFSKIRQKYM